MSERRSSFLAIFLGVFAAVSLIGLCGVASMSWIVGKSFDAMIDRLLSDTGSFFVPDEAEIEHVEEVDLEALSGDEELIVEYD